jgi:hypothetical protein
VLGDEALALGSCQGVGTWGMRSLDYIPRLCFSSNGIGRDLIRLGRPSRQVVLLPSSPDTIAIKVMDLGMWLSGMVRTTNMRALLIPAMVCLMEQTLMGEDVCRRAGPGRYARFRV